MCTFSVVSKLPEYRYCLVKEMDRISIPRLNPTLIYVVKKVFPAHFTKKQVFENCDGIKTKETEIVNGTKFFITQFIAGIDISKRRKNTWDIKHYILNYTK